VLTGSPKKWLLETFIQAEGLSWDDPWLQSIDLEYHNIDPRRGLFFSITPGKRITSGTTMFAVPSAMHVPPQTRAHPPRPGRYLFPELQFPYVINWDSIACDSRDFLVMGNPFETYNDEVDRFLSKPRLTNVAGESAEG